MNKTNILSIPILVIPLHPTTYKLVFKKTYKKFLYIYILSTCIYEIR